MNLIAVKKSIKIREKYTNYILELAKHLNLSLQKVMTDKGTISEEGIVIETKEQLTVFNRSESPANMTVNWNEIGYPNHLMAVVRDIWEKKDIGDFTEKFTGMVPAHGAIAIRVMP